MFRLSALPGRPVPGAGGCGIQSAPHRLRVTPKPASFAASGCGHGPTRAAAGDHRTAGAGAGADGGHHHLRRRADLQRHGAAQMLTAHGLPGTFFINSGNIGKPGYLSLPELDGIAADGQRDRRAHRQPPRSVHAFTADEIRRAGLRRPRQPCWAGDSRCATSPTRSATPPRRSSRSSPTAATTAPAASAS